MIYLLNDTQLLPVWNAIQSLTKVRETTDVIEQGIALSEAQALLVAFAFQLELSSRDRASPFIVEVPVKNNNEGSVSP